MPRVISKAIANIDHDPVTLALTVTFHGTGAYIYYGVPRAVYEAFLAAPSAGQFFNERIRDRYRESR